MKTDMTIDELIKKYELKSKQCDEQRDGLIKFFKNQGNYMIVPSEYTLPLENRQYVCEQVIADLKSLNNKQDKLQKFIDGRISHAVKILSKDHDDDYHRAIKDICMIISSYLYFGVFDEDDEI